MTSESGRIVVVEDEPEMAEGLKHNLELEGYEVKIALDGEAGLEIIRDWTPHLVLLDLMLPKIHGLEVLKQVRSEGIWCPIVILTAMEQEENIVSGLELGADDYVCKPFSLAELLARIRAVIRRCMDGGPAEENILVLGGTTFIDFMKYEIRRDGMTMPLSKFEADILRYLLANRGSVVSRENLLKDVWGYSILPQTRTVDNHVARIRKKVEATPDDPTWIQTVHGIGYRFNLDEESS